MFRVNELNLPILEVSQEGILSSNGDFTVCYRITRPPLFYLPPKSLEAIHDLWLSAIRALPFGSIIHLQDIYFKGEMSWDWEHKGYCFITFRNPDRKPGHSGSSSLLSPSLVPEFVLDPKLLQPFLDQCEQFRSLLTRQGYITLSTLTPDDLLGARTRMGVLERYCMMNQEEGDSGYVDVEFCQEEVMAGKAGVIYSLSDLERFPAECKPWKRYEPYSTEATTIPVGFAAEMGPLSQVGHIYNQYIFKDDPQKTIAGMEKRLGRMRSLAGKSRANAVACEALEKFLQDAASSQRMVVKAHFNIMAWAEEKDKVKSMQRKVSSAIARMGALPYKETTGAPQLWWAGIPGNAGEFPMNDAVDCFVEQAVCFLVMEDPDRGWANAFGIELGERYTGRSMIVDISDEPMRLRHIFNRNKFVLGSSGSGKSFFINHLCEQYFNQGAHILLIDIGGSYRGLSFLLGGQYFTYSEDQPIRFNPFRLETGEMPDSEKKESIKALLLTLWKRSDEAFRRSEYVALSNALHGYYQYLAKYKGIFPCFDSFYVYLKDIFSIELAGEKINREDFDIDNFLYVLKPYYKGGEYDYLLNATDLPSLLEQRMIVFELDRVKDHPILFPVVTIIIMELFLNKMRQLQGIRKVIVIEEAWKAIAKEGMGEYIKYLFKTVRKFFGEAIVVTQDIEDVISSPIVKNAIINNADCKILLDQSKFLHRFAEIKALLGLTDHEEALVLSLNRDIESGHDYREVFIGFADNYSKVYRCELNMEQKLAYSTEESQRVLVEKYAKEEGSIQEGLEVLAMHIRSGTVKLSLILIFCGFLTVLPTSHSSAQVLEIADLVSAAVKKAIVSADLEVQRLQTQTIALQDAAKALENSMAGDLLGDITDWVQQQEDLYGAYYQELWQVKSALSTYSKTATLIQRQVALVKEEQQDWSAVQQDPHFSAAELSHIANVYQGILQQSSRNVQQIELVIKAFVTQMDDGGRLRIIDETSKGIDANTQDLRQFTQENSLLSLQRAKDENDLLTIKILYNL